MNFLTITDQERCRVDTLHDDHRALSVSDLVRQGLTRDAKHLSPILFYDDAGSLLFEKICDLPEYYLTRTEQSILDSHISEIVENFDRDLELIELGSGNSSKTRSLLTSLLDNGHEVTYRPIDISEAMLRSTAESLTNEYPKLIVEAIASDYHHGLAEVSKRRSKQKVFVFLGSNLGNFTEVESEAFLADIQSAMAPNDLLLLGVDLVKDEGVLTAAYDDAAGVTRAFNLNLLTRLNRELGANFRLDQFDHQAIWDAEVNAMQAFLVSKKSQAVHISDLGLTIQFETGETIHTESSHKYTLEALVQIASNANLQQVADWADRREWFVMSLFKPLG